MPSVPEEEVRRRPGDIPGWLSKGLFQDAVEGRRPERPFFLRGMNLTVLEIGDKKKTLGVHLCWNCQQETSSSPFCDHCLKIQPTGPETDYFSFMGLSLVPKIDLKTLEEIFYNLSRKLHPDFYQDKSEREKALSLENSAVLNRAYRTLRDPVRRAEYLVQLEEGPDAISDNRPPQELLEEVLEYHERLEEPQGLSPKDKGRWEEIAQGLERVKAQFQRKETDLFQGLEDLFERWDQKEPEARKALLEETKLLLSQRNYIRNVIPGYRRRTGARGGVRMSVIIGIDLGTTKSVVAYMEGGKPRVIPDAKGNPILPSAVAFTGEGALVGEPAKQQALARPRETVYSVKRFMGKGLEDVKADLDFLPFHLSPEHLDVVRLRWESTSIRPPRSRRLS